MQHLIASVRQSVKDQNWYAALVGALTLPDIAGKLDSRYPKRPGDRYVAWFNDYLLPTYTRNGKTMLTGGDCYVLRCAFLHEGDFDVSNQRSKDVLDSFLFVKPRENMVIHRTYNQVNQSKFLQLQVDLFALEVCEAADLWLVARGTDNSVATAIARLPEISSDYGLIAIIPEPES